MINFNPDVWGFHADTTIKRNAGVVAIVLKLFHSKADLSSSLQRKYNKKEKIITPSLFLFKLLLCNKLRLSNTLSMALAVSRAVKRVLLCSIAERRIAHHLRQQFVCSNCVNDSFDFSLYEQTWNILIIITNLTNRLGLQSMTGKEGCCPFCRKGFL